MSPGKHVAMGVAGGTLIYIVSRNIALSAGFFIGSWIADFDHVWQYWRMNHFKKPFAVKDFLKFNDALTEKFINGQPWLHVLFLHSIEFLLLILALGLYGVLSGMVIHLILDDIFLYRYVKGNFLKRAHSIVEYYIRSRVFKEQKYEDIYS